MARGGEFIAGGDIRPHRFVKLSDDFTVVEAGGGDLVVGISGPGSKLPPLDDLVSTNYHARQGDPVQVFGPGEECLLVSDGTATSGALLKSDAEGRGTAAIAGDKAGAVAFEDDTGTDQLVRVRVEIVTA